MKTFKYFSMMLAMLVCSIGFVSCSSDDDDDDVTTTNSIYGTWMEEGDDDSEYLTLTFNRDGTGLITVISGKTTITEPFEFFYDKEEKELDIVPKGQGGKLLDGTWDVVITPSTLQLKGYVNGSYSVYQFKRK